MSYRRILAFINEHSGSTVSARYAMGVAASIGADLVLYSTIDESTDAAVSHRVERHLFHILDDAAVLGIPVTRISESGPIARRLPHRVKAEGADLVFYPLTPGEQYGATLQRHTSHKLLQTIEADLAVMRIMHMGKPHPRHILVPVSGVISNSEQRARFLAVLARAFHSRVTLFHRLGVGRQQVPDDFIALRNDLLRRDQPVLERSASGRIDRAITMEAVSHHNDLIVLGASERSALRRMLFGNPAGDVMHQPPCNAILFRPARQLP